MKQSICNLLTISLLGTVCITGSIEAQQGPAMSAATQTCLSCHGFFHPGIKFDWERSHHAKVTPAEALTKEKLKKSVSSEKIPADLLKTVVGCAECHTLHPENHPDTFEHNGYKVHVVVTPSDCSVCHVVETEQYGNSLMAYAHVNLNNNTFYQGLMTSINGNQSFEPVKTTLKPANPETNADSCFYCHGTEIKATGQWIKDTEFGKMEFPVLSGWPNQGSGRVNPDGSKGGCTACHPRHQFSVAVARKPDTCSECHKGPDVNTSPVYEVSKHGNIYFSIGKNWNFDVVPWTIGQDLTAPTCATCHISLIVNWESGNIIERTHQMSDRLAWRLLGLIYAHAHPKSPDTTTIRNKAGLPLPTELTGEPVSEYLIDGEEQARRDATMQKICQFCHAEGWVKGQFGRLDNTIKTSNEMTLAATKILQTAWDKGAAKGLSQEESPFDEAIEKKWVEQWFFYASTTRFNSAMGGADYGVFANGRWALGKNVQDMLDWLEFKLQGNLKKANKRASSAGERIDDEEEGLGGRR
jgi:hydroxylamine dehydrogenase